ncbi:MAG: hypothetical protein U0271_36550 [Polyangiaceae bacterium]
MSGCSSCDDTHPPSGGGGEGGSGGSPATGGGGSGGVGGLVVGGGGSGGEVVFDCDALPSPPLAFEELFGFTASEDFAFDEQGNYVGFDDSGNLVRISKTGTITLWAPNVGYTAGMAVLPDGSVVVADVGEGALKRVYPNGAITVLLGGLLYPNGLDIGPDGYVYVAENYAGRVRRVDPDTGDFSIVAVGLEGANGVAFATDPALMYVGSFEGSGVYKIVIPAPGELGEASVFARPNGSHLKEPTPACAGEVGVPCYTTTGGQRGTCVTIANVVDCVPGSECDGASPGAPCTFAGGPGVCRNGGLGLVCSAPDDCDGKSVNASCAVLGRTGKCSYDQFGGLLCNVDACASLTDFANCNTLGGVVGYCLSGRCQADPCHVASPNAPCFDGALQGTCIDQGFGLTCITNDCAGGTTGDLCLANGQSGNCALDLNGVLACDTDPCTSGMIGQVCTDAFGAGVCVASASGASCAKPTTCDTAAVGAPCLFRGEPGVCATGSAGPYCEVPCRIGTVACSAEAGNGTCSWDGVCTVSPCDQSSTCGDAGTCAYDGNSISCSNPFAGNAACAGHNDGQLCKIGAEDGLCQLDRCVVASASLAACVGKTENSPCSGDFSGVCKSTADGLACQPSNAIPCTTPGDPCANGYCGDLSGQLACVDVYTFLTAPCVGAPEGADCQLDTIDGAHHQAQCSGGYCQPETLYSSPCTGKSLNETCEFATDVGTVPGVCVDWGGAALDCQAGGFGQGPGGIDGLGVDTCGNVYASEYVHGNLWRIAPDGTIELAAQLPSSWVPNMEWGRGLGGFEKNHLFIADRDQQRLFSVAVGVPGATEFYDIQKP